MDKKEKMLVKEMEYQKPCEVKDSDDYNCLLCINFDECQMSHVKNVKTDLALDDDY